MLDFNLSINNRIRVTRRSGYSTDKLNALKDKLDPYVEDGRLPNYLLSIYHKGNLIYEAKKGHVDVSLEKPIERDTIFWVASMTKAVTSVAALQLVEQGKLSLDAPLSDYLPEFADLLVAPGGAWGQILCCRWANPYQAFVYPYFGVKLRRNYCGP